ncbi:MAG TPA: aminodeoxychorismate synthase component I [Cellvibrio sp.]|nr:aminodeoxychorismate synthase component I [Cellvibrio sp.]
MPATAQLIAIPYLTDSAEWFHRIRHLPQAIWLDSGRPQSDYGRFDILSAAPALSFETRGAVTAITQNGSVTYSSDNPFELLAPYLVATTPVADMPFLGGVLGYFGYDLGRRLEKLPQTSLQDIALPEMCVGIYPWAIVQDHRQHTAWLILNPALAPAYNFSEIRQITAFHEPQNHLKFATLSFVISKFESDLNANQYASALAEIQAYIHAGDCYQVNFAQRFSSTYRGDPLAAYLELRSALPSPFSAFMQLSQGAVLSLSPERFIRLCGEKAETQPIKGTIARGSTEEQDRRNAALLQASLKDRAENLMIVDLLRNDLSKTCTQVRVPELFSLQSFANVHHLVSTVTGKLKPQSSPLQLLASSFPGGSITGAPKIRAMEIIEELEPTRRSVYCGSLGYISSCGNMDTSIAIRTLVCADQKIYCWGGGGIVADSGIAEEYQETLAKVKVLMDTLENRFGQTP